MRSIEPLQILSSAPAASLPGVCGRLVSLGEKPFSTSTPGCVPGTHLAASVLGAVSVPKPLILRLLSGC